MSDMLEFQKRQIEALQIENLRLNNLLKKRSLTKISDPNFDKKLSELTKIYK